MHLIQKKFEFILYGLILSTVIGFISFLFLRVEAFFTEFFWEKTPQIIGKSPFYFLALCLIGSGIVIFLKNKWGDYPETAHDTMNRLKQDKTLDYSDVFKGLVMAAIILMFGAGVGPEAALLSAVISLSIWQADKLRFLFFNQDEINQLPFLERAKTVLHPTKNFQKYSEELALKDETILKKKKLLNLLFIVNGLVTLTVLMKSTNQPSFITKVGMSSWHFKELWIFIPIVLLSFFWAYGYRWLKIVIKRVMDQLLPKMPQRIIFGGLMIFVFSQMMPSLLHSGQMSISPLIETRSSSTFMVLLILAIMKLVLLQFCLTSGWTGGDIFPIFFAALLVGAGITKLFPGMDPVFIMAITASSFTISILNKSPIFIGLFTALFFPINTLPVILLVILVFWSMNKYFRKQNQMS